MDSNKIEYFIKFTLMFIMISKHYCVMTNVQIYEYKYEKLSKILFYTKSNPSYAIVSAKNCLLKFISTNLLEPVEIRITGPVNDSASCVKPDTCFQFICSPEMSQDKCRLKVTDVYVKSWTIADSKLVVCYNVYQGYCETIDFLDNFKKLSLGKAYSIVTSDLKSHSSILYFKDKLYVAIEINPNLNFQSIEFNTISIRMMPNMEIIKSDMHMFIPYYGKLGSGLKTIFPLEFKGSFRIYDQRKDVTAFNYIFFLVNQPENKIDPKNGKFQMRLVRLCSQDGDFSSLIDIGMYCENKKPQTYYQIDSWYLAYVSEDLAQWYRKKTRFPNIQRDAEADFNQILYLSLKTIRITDNYKETLNSFVICAFPIAEIMEMFDIVKNRCINGIGSINDRPYDINSIDKPCEKDANTNKSPGYCGGITKNKHIIGDHFGNHSIVGYKIMSEEGMRGSSLVVFQIYEKYTIAVIGGSNGSLIQTELFEDRYFQNAVSKKLYNDSYIDMKLNEDNTTIFTVTDKKIINYDFRNCHFVEKCEACLSLSPFCGWCVSKGKCVTRSNCNPVLWIPHERDKYNIKCPEIRNLPSHSNLEYVNNIPMIHFQILKTPNIMFSQNSQILQCQYLVNNVEKSIVQAQYFPNNYSVACKGPSLNDISFDRENKNFMDFKLRVLVDGSYLVESDYYIYNCDISKTCTRCTDSKFNCTWCVLDNQCIPTHLSKCRKDYKILSNSSSACPKLEVPNKILAFHSDTPINIRINITKFKNFFNVKTDFFCIESCENNEVRATMTESPGLFQCMFKNIKLKNGAVLCSLKIMWRLGNALSGIVESDNLVQFEVYDCSRLAEHCDDCVLLPTKYQCGFCSSIQTCVQKNKCNSDEKWTNSKTQKCPFPLITEIIPENSTLTSETVILVKGRNLGFHYSNIKDKISLENAQLHISCKFVEQSFISAKQFMCKIQNVTDRIGTPVTFQFIFRAHPPYLTKKEFYFFNPQVKEIKPSSGPLFGGTVIEIAGTYLNIGLKREINFKYGNTLIPCEILRNSEALIMCRISEFRSNGLLIRFKRSIRPVQAFLQISIDQNTISFYNINYNFSSNPNIAMISRNKIIFEGGQIVKISGENLRSIHKPCLSFYCNNELSMCQNCWINETDILCITPNTVPVNKSLDCQFLFGMENGSVSIYNATVKVFPVPSFMKFRDTINLPSTSFSFIKTIIPNNEILFSVQLNDQTATESFIKSDINISIGSLSCKNISIHGRQIQCSIERDLIDIYQKYPIFLKIGYKISINLGRIQFEKGDIAIDNITVIILTLIIICFIAVVIVMSVLVVRKISKKQKLKSKKQNLFNEKAMKEANDIIKGGITELNKVAILDEIHKNWNTAPIHPYNVYILYSHFPNTHPRLYKENKNMNESLFDLNYYKYDSSFPATHPLIFDGQIQVIENTIEYSRKLSKLFEDDLFVLMFFSFLDAESKEAESKKSDIISFLSLILMKDMSNYTKILKILIKNDFEKKKANQEEKSMFRQSDLLCKLLSNWFFILMYDHLQNINAGGDLLILYLTILNIINNGPVNYKLPKSQYALNENSLLDRKVDFKKLKIYIKQDIVEDAVSHLTVLDCDCIPQVKLKIFEAIYKYTPYSTWVNMDDYDIVKDNQDEASESEQLLTFMPLKEQVGNVYKILRDYEIKDGDTLCLIQKFGSRSESNAASVTHSLHVESLSSKTNLSRTNLTKATGKTFQLTPQMTRKASVHNLTESIHEKSAKKKKSSCYSRNKVKTAKNSGDVKQICLIYTQVLKTKIEQQIKNLFDDIFDIESVPPFLVDLFTHFNNICKEDSVVFAVKSNSLILRFWIQLINNVDFLFDIPLIKHTPVLECLKCISRVLMDICSENQNKEVWLPQLFSDIIKLYSSKVSSYYDGIKTIPNCNEYYTSSKIDGINISLAIVILYQNYIKHVHDELIEVIQNSNNPKNKQNEWIYILKEVNNLYIPEPFQFESNGDVKTTIC